jgi:GNAT superfamily N-acetyltransferase
MLHNFIEKIFHYQRENGTRQLIRKCLIKLENALFFYNREVVGYISVIDQAFYPSPKIPLTIRAAEKSDIRELQICTTGYKKRDFSHWINENYIFYIAQLKDPEAIDEASSLLHEGEMQSGPLTLKRPLEEARSLGIDKTIVGYICICPANKSKHKLVSLLKLMDTDYWAVDAYIHPAYRAKGINAAIASVVLAHAKREGYKRGYGTILFNNTASRRSYGFIGEKEIGLFTTITIGGVAFHFLRRNKGYEEYFN